MIPATVRQLVLEANKAHEQGRSDLTVDGRPANLVRLWGMVVSITAQSGARTVYAITDGTGTIEATHYHDDAGAADANIATGDLVLVYARARIHAPQERLSKTQRLTATKAVALFVHSVQKVGPEFASALILHPLEVMASHAFATKGPLPAKQSQPAAAPMQGMQQQQHQQPAGHGFAAFDSGAQGGFGGFGGFNEGTQGFGGGFGGGFGEGYQGFGGM
jgi:hypothetical protein